MPRHGLGELGDGVVPVEHRPVPGPAVRGQPHPGDALLGGLDQVEPPIAPIVTLNPPTSPIASVHPLEQLRVLVDQPCAPYFPPASSSAGTPAPRHAPACAPRRSRCRDDRQDHRVHVLHVDGPTPPDAAVGDLAAERVDASSRPRRAGRRRDARAPAARRGPDPSPSIRATTLARRSSPRRSVARARPRRASPRRTRPPPAPRAPTSSPGLVESIRIRSRHSSTTSSSATGGSFRSGTAIAVPSCLRHPVPTHPRQSLLTLRSRRGMTVPRAGTTSGWRNRQTR